MKELYEKYVGKGGHIFLGGLKIHVICKDVKLSWGKERFLVEPTAGQGEIWVESLILIKE